MTLLETALEILTNISTDAQMILSSLAGHDEAAAVKTANDILYNVSAGMQTLKDKAAADAQDAANAQKVTPVGGVTATSPVVYPPDPGTEDINHGIVHNEPVEETTEEDQALDEDDVMGHAGGKHKKHHNK